MENVISNPYFKNEHLVMYTKSKILNDLGVDHIYLAQDSDLQNFTEK